MQALVNLVLAWYVDAPNSTRIGKRRYPSSIRKQVLGFQLANREVSSSGSDSSFHPIRKYKPNERGVYLTTPFRSSLSSSPHRQQSYIHSSLMSKVTRRRSSIYSSSLVCFICDGQSLISLARLKVPVCPCAHRYREYLTFASPPLLVWWPVASLFLLAAAFRMCSFFMHRVSHTI